jgi:hypothetical protein
MRWWSDAAVANEEVVEFDCFIMSSYWMLLLYFFSHCLNEVSNFISILRYSVLWLTLELVLKA